MNIAPVATVPEVNLQPVNEQDDETMEYYLVIVVTYRPFGLAEIDHLRSHLATICAGPVQVYNAYGAPLVLTNTDRRPNGVVIAARRAASITDAAEAVQALLPQGRAWPPRGVLACDVVQIDPPHA